MSYIDKGRRYTYGVKNTLADVAAIGGVIATGDTVFCLENNRMMTYDTNGIWMCNDFIKLTNNSGVTLSKGDVVIVDTTTAGSVTRTTTQGNTLVVGPVVFGNDVTRPVAIAISGIYDVRTNGSTNAGDYAFTSTTIGAGDSTTTMGDGFFGVYVSQNAAAGLTKCFIRSKPEYF
jgi:hypothetical protein